MGGGKLLTDVKLSPIKEDQAITDLLSRVSNNVEDEFPQKEGIHAEDTSPTKSSGKGKGKKPAGRDNPFLELRAKAAIRKRAAAKAINPHNRKRASDLNDELVLKDESEDIAMEDEPKVPGDELPSTRKRKEFLSPQVCSKSKRRVSVVKP